MTVGDKQYNEGDMLRMQREAEMRVREMHQRARKTVEQANATGMPPGGRMPQRGRNWNSNPGYYRQRGGSQQPRQSREAEREKPPETPRKEEPEKAAEVPSPKKDGTVLGDIMAALGLDEDYLLIIGLILILINQRADTTLILALAYLLI